MRTKLAVYAVCARETNLSQICFVAGHQIFSSSYVSVSTILRLLLPLKKKFLQQTAVPS